MRRDKAGTVGFESPSSGAKLRAAAPFLGLLILSGVFVLLTAGHSTRLTESFHGLYHAAYVTQIANGIIPPTNPSSIGMPANYYWAWHGLLALLSRGLGISIFQSNLFVSWLSLTAFLSVMWAFAGRRAWSQLSRLAACFLPFIILDPLGLSGYLFSALSASGVPEVLTPSVVHLMPAKAVFGVDLHPIAGHPLNKFCNFSSFPAAFALYALALLVFARPGPLLARCCALFSCSALCMAFSPLPGAGIAGGAIAFTIAGWTEGKRGRALWAPAAATFGGLLAALPHLLSISKAYGSEMHFFLEPMAFARHALEVGWPLAAVVPVYFLAAIWVRNLATEERAWWILGIGLSLVAMMVKVPVDAPNEYKLILLTGLPSSLLTLAIGREFSRRLPVGARTRQAFRALATLLLIAGAGIALGATTTLYRSAVWARQNPYRYIGRHLELTKDAPPKRLALADAYYWLREHTPSTAYVLERPVHGNKVLIPAIAERRVVTVSLWHHNEAIPHQRQLQRQVNLISIGLANCKVSQVQLNELFKLSVPWPETLYAVAPVGDDAPFSGCGEGLDPRIGITHQNQFYRVFSIRR